MDAFTSRPTQFHFFTLLKAFTFNHSFGIWPTSWNRAHLCAVWPLYFHLVQSALKTPSPISFRIQVIRKHLDLIYFGGGFFFINPTHQPLKYASFFRPTPPPPPTSPFRLLCKTSHAPLLLVNIPILNCCQPPFAPFPVLRVQRPESLFALLFNFDFQNSKVGIDFEPLFTLQKKVSWPFSKEKMEQRKLCNNIVFSDHQFLPTLSGS